MAGRKDVMTSSLVPTISVIECGIEILLVLVLDGRYRNMRCSNQRHWPSTEVEGDSLKKEISR